MPTHLSDKALAVFAFAAYHQLTSGEHVSEVVLNAGGHTADPEAVDELTRSGLLTVTDDRGAFTEDGQAMFDKALAGLRSAVP